MLTLVAVCCCASAVCSGESCGAIIGTSGSWGAPPPVAGTTATRGRCGPLGTPATGEGGAGTSSPSSANKSSLLTSEVRFCGARGRTFFAVAQGNAFARGFCVPAQPETTAATAHRIAQISLGERVIDSSEAPASFGRKVGVSGEALTSLGEKVDATIEARTRFDEVGFDASRVDSTDAAMRGCAHRDVAARTLSEMEGAISIVQERESGRERQLDTEYGSAADLRRKVYRTVVELNNSEGAGQTDAASAGPRGEK